MELHAVEQKSSREYKDTFFRALFHEEGRALELCNAIEDTSFPTGTPIKFYMRGDTSLTRRNNDLAFVVGEPTPKFYVLYNGKDELKNDVLRLSDAFRFDDYGFSLELTVKIININHGSGSEVLSKSPSLNGYSYLVSQIRKHIDSGMVRDKAISLAVNHCIEKDILADFLNENYKEVCGMFDWGITIEEEMEIREEEAEEKGKKEGYLEAAYNFLQNGTSFQDVVRILKLSDAQIQNLKERAI